jgi:lysophospholipase L1-like esterase
LIPALITCHHPKKIVVNLGFNDLHYETSPEETLKDSEEFVRRVRKDLPDAKIYLLNVCHLHGPIYYFRREIQYNRLLEETWKGQKDISVIPVDQVFLKDGEIRPDMDSLCALDLYHLNVRGYRLWVSFFLPYVDRENGSIIARR